MKIEKVFQIVYFVLAALFVSAGLNYRTETIYSTASALLGIAGAIMLGVAYFVMFRDRK
jgi:hypothetical protein